MWRRCNVTASNDAGASPELTLSFTTPAPPPGTASPSPPAKPPRPVLAGQPAITTTTATVSFYSVPRAADYEIVCSTVLFSSQYATNFSDSTKVVVLVSGLAPNTPVT